MGGGLAKLLLILGAVYGALAWDGGALDVSALDIDPSSALSAGKEQRYSDERKGSEKTGRPFFLVEDFSDAVDESQLELQDAPDYSCIQHSGRFLTIARTSRGMIPLIVWQREVFGSQWTPEARCKAVSSRFQSFAQQDQLQYISTGELNNYPIICVSEEYGDCLSQGLLLTLEPQDNPTQVLKELFNLSDAITRSTTKPVIDLEYILEEKKTLSPVGPEAGAVSTPEN